MYVVILKLPENVRNCSQYGLGGKNTEKGLGDQQFHSGGHLKIYITGETLL